MVSYHPHQVAQRLGISSSTLRLWSNHFAHLLSEGARRPAASDAGGPARQRRYSEEDLELLLQVRRLLADGLTYQEVKAHLTPPPGDAGGAEPSPAPATNDPTQPLRLALQAQERTIAALRETIAVLELHLRTLLQEREDARARERLLLQRLSALASASSVPERESPRRG